MTGAQQDSSSGTIDSHAALSDSSLHMPTPPALPHLQSVVPDDPSGADVLCLHGLFAGSWVFDQLLPMIAARGHPAHAISYRGHPPNAPLDNIGRVSIADYANDAADAARSLDRP